VASVHKSFERKKNGFHKAGSDSIGGSKEEKPIN